MPAHPAARSGARAVSRAVHMLTSVAMGTLLAVLTLGLALDGSLRHLGDGD